MGNQQLIIEGAGPPGEPNSYYSEQKTLVATGTSPGSPPVAQTEFTPVPEAGFIFFLDLPANVSVVLQLPTSPVTYAPLIAASGQGQSWSDGFNLLVRNAGGAPANVDYFVLGFKP